MKIENFVDGFANQFDDTDTSEFQAATNFHELEEWSSLTAMAVIAFVKTEYDKAITGKEIRSCKTIQDLFNLVASK